MAGRADLPRHGDVQRRTQLSGHLSGDGHPTSGQAEHHRIGPLLLSEPISELPARIGTVSEASVGECFHAIGVPELTMAERSRPRFMRSCASHRDMLVKPAGSESSHFFQRAGLLEQVSGALHDLNLG